MDIEARAEIEDIVEFKNNLDKLGIEYIRNYSVTDYVFMPKGKEWDLNNQSMKIRTSSGEKKIFLKYHLVEWKDNIKFDIHNLNLMFKSLDEAFRVMDEWNFEQKFNYTKKGEIYKLDDAKIFVEEIDNLGYLVEVESDSPGIIDNLFNKLNLKKINKSVPKLYEEYESSK